MKKYIYVLALLFSIPAYAFDYHGIKSGMSKSEVSAVLSKLGTTQDEYNQVDLLMGDVKKLKGVKYSPIMISFTYNYDGKLYKMQLNYYQDQSGPKGIGLKAALESKFKAVVREGRVKLYTSSIDTTVALLIDDEIVKKSIAHHKNTLLKEL